MDNMANRSAVCGRVIDWVGLSAIGIFCLCYSIFWSSFAEIHITVPFLDFPIFVGEILLAVCVVLLVVKWKVTAFRFNAWYYLLGAYVGWVLIKALGGYFVFGPLAFRNAALFYYPFFAVATYHFFSKEYFDQRIIAVFLAIFLAVKAFIGVIKHFFFPYLALSFILILKLERRWLRYCACIVLLWLFPYKIFFHGSRSFLLGNVAAFLFLILFFIFGILKIEKKYKVYFLLVMLAVLGWGTFKFSRSARQIESLMAPVRLMEKFREYDEFIQRQKKGFKPQELDVRLYNENATNYIHKALGHAEDGKAKGQQEEISAKEAMVIIERKLDAVIEEMVAKKDIFEEVTLKDAVDTAAGIMKEQKEMPLEVIGNGDKKDIFEEVTLKDAVDTAAGIMKEQKEMPLEVIGNGDKKDIFEEVTLKDAVDTDAGIMKEQKKMLPEVIEDDGNKDVLEKKKRVEEISQRYVETLKDYERRISAGLADPGKTNAEERVLEKKALEHLLRDVMESLAEQKEIVSEAITDVRSAVTKSLRTLNVEQGNMLFRMFIWRDMLNELTQEKPLFGFSFGKPQRSISIEILDQAHGEWTRDGWITPHNVFLHVIYRAGIIGVLLIAGFFIALFSLVKTFIQERAVTGLLLVSILIFWIVVASFLVVLELPYQAIPFWALFGIALAYGKTLKSMRV
jgi:hypothetical protein